MLSLAPLSTAPLDSKALARYLARHLCMAKSRGRPDAADYVGPIEVKAVDPLRGRGLYATRDIEIGELLVR